MIETLIIFPPQDHEYCFSLGGTLWSGAPKEKTIIEIKRIPPDGFPTFLVKLKDGSRIEVGGFPYKAFLKPIE